MLDNTIFYSYLDSPLEKILIARNSAGLTHILFQTEIGTKPLGPGWRFETEPPREVANQFQAYFAGELYEFDLPLSPSGTSFQLEVWQALQAIPYGQTISYAELARKIGKPRAMRAVGAANGRNPLPIVIPCHRVIGSNGSLTGYGGGLWRKQWLLEHERRIITKEGVS